MPHGWLIEDSLWKDSRYLQSVISVRSWIFLFVMIVQVLYAIPDLNQFLSKLYLVIERVPRNEECNSIYLLICPQTKYMFLWETHTCVGRLTWQVPSYQFCESSLMAYGVMLI